MTLSRIGTLKSNFQRRISTKTIICFDMKCQLTALSCSRLLSGEIWLKTSCSKECLQSPEIGVHRLSPKGQRNAIANPGSQHECLAIFGPLTLEVPCLAATTREAASSSLSFVLDATNHSWIRAPRDPTTWYNRLLSTNSLIGRTPLKTILTPVSTLLLILGITAFKNPEGGSAHVLRPECSVWYKHHVAHRNVCEF